MLCSHIWKQSFFFLFLFIYLFFNPLHKNEVCPSVVSCYIEYVLSLSPFHSFLRFPFFTQPLHYLFVGASITCDEPKTAYTVVRTYKSNSAEENIEIWEGASNTGVRVLFETGVSHENSVVNYEVCLSPAVHTFVCTDGYSFLYICPLFAE